LTRLLDTTGSLDTGKFGEWLLFRKKETFSDSASLCGFDMSFDVPDAG
jgi:hypothetical protein